jgi:hypothetical protein
MVLIDYCGLRNTATRQRAASGNGTHQNCFSSLRCEDLLPILYIISDAAVASKNNTANNVFLFILDS